MKQNRGFRGRDFRNSPAAGRSNPNQRYEERWTGAVEQVKGNQLQETVIRPEELLYIGVSASFDASHSGSVLYSKSDGLDNFNAPVYSKRVVKKGELTNEYDYIGYSFKLPRKGTHVFMVGMRPNHEAFGLDDGTVEGQRCEWEEFCNCTLGFYVNGTTLQIYGLSAVYTFSSWEANDKLEQRYYRDGTITFLRNGVAEYSSTATGFSNMGPQVAERFDSTVYWGWKNCEYAGFQIAIRTTTPDEPFIYDLRCTGNSEVRLPFQDLFNLPTSSLKMRPAGTGAVTGSDAQGITFVKRTSGTGWTAGFKSDVLFDPAFGGDIVYCEVSKSLGGDQLMVAGLCDDDADPSTTNWYNDNSLRGAVFNGDSSNTKFNTVYKGGVLNAESSYKIHASGSVKFARVFKRESNSGWQVDDKDYLSSILFYHPNGTQLDSVSQDWIPICYSVGANANSNYRARYAIAYKDCPSEGAIHKITYATSSRAGFRNDYSTNFDGSNDFVDLGNSLNSSFELGDSFSVSAWIKFNDTTTDRTIVANLDSGTKGFQLRLRPTEQVRFGIAQTPSVYGVVDTSVLATGKWHHVVGTYDGTNVTGLKVYANGNLDTGALDSAGTILDITNTETIKIGKYAGGQFYAANIDEVSLFNKELSSSEITALYNGGVPSDITSHDGLIGWWRMGDGANYPTIPDASSNSNDGTMTNMAQNDIEPDVPGKPL